MNKKTSVTVLFNPEAFEAMTADDIAKYIREHRKVAIVGEEVGVDRHIISYAEVSDWLNYQNPFSK